MRRRFCLVLLTILSLAFAVSSFAQTFGQITGMVTDTTGGVLVGATVTVTSTQTGATVTQQANSAGLYVFPNLLPGVFNVKVEMDGFRSATRNKVELQIQQTARLDFKLEIGSLNETVEAVGTAPMLNTTDATIGTVVDRRQVVELPLNGRNFIRLVALSPNVTADYGGASGGGASGRQGGDRATQSFSVAGQRREYNQYTLDGVVNQDVNFNTYAFLPSIDAVEEFKVQTGVYSAEFGREAAQVNVSTKSGTNEYRAVLFEFVRDDAFDALPYPFTSVRPAKAPFKWNQFGFTLGGPVRIPGVGRQTFFGCVIEHIQDVQQHFDADAAGVRDDLRCTHVEQRLRREAARPTRLEQNALRALRQRDLGGCRPGLAAESLEVGGDEDAGARHVDGSHDPKGVRPIVRQPAIGIGQLVRITSENASTEDGAILRSGAGRAAGCLKAVPPGVRVGAEGLPSVRPPLFDGHHQAVVRE